MGDIAKKNFWEKAWGKVRAGIVKHEDFEYISYLQSVPKHAKSIEIGGFPGRVATYFAKYLGYDVTILDYCVKSEVIRDIERINGLENGTIKVINEDFLKFDPMPDYDLVTSFGFVEHFSNVGEVLQKHINLLRPGGLVLVTFPNFLGINGYFKKHLEPEIYYTHNTEIMNIPYFKSIVETLDLDWFEVKYYGKPYLWHDKKRIYRRLCSFMNSVIKYFPIENSRFWSPFILLVGKKRV